MSPTGVPRTLADQLRSWSPAQLACLLERRPDLTTPAPQDSSQLASRASTRASVLRAVDSLTQLELAVLEAALTLPAPVAATALHERVYAAPGSVDTALGTLRELVLLWGEADALRPVSVLHEVLTGSGSVTRLGPPVETLLAGAGPNRVANLVRDLGLDPSGDRDKDVATLAATLADPEQVTALVDGVDDAARAVLERLEREGVDGRMESAGRTVRRAEATRPVEQLLARGLLLPRDTRHVTVPREVAVALRGGRLSREPADVEPQLATSSRDRALVDRAAAGAAFELVRHIELLLEHWGTHPPSALRSGGLGVRELKAAAELLHLDERAAALHVEIAHAAGLIAVGATDDLDAAWLPTDAFDVWNAGSVADRWGRLAQAWLDSPRMIGLVGSRANGKPVNALGPDLERAWLPEARRMALAAVGELPEGEVLASGTGVASLVDRVRWRRPRRPAQRAEAVAWVVEEAAQVGVLALGGLAAHGRALLSTDDPHHAAPAALEPLLPEPVDHVLLQADLTAVAPGPLAHELAHQLAAMADIESRGGATVYRFTATSVRRAFDSGWSAQEVHDFVASASRTPVPQPLVYLVDDVARRFGTLRVGAAGSFLRSDDEAALAELVHGPGGKALRLRRIAPTVVVSDMPVDVLLPRLRELGAAPVVEAPDGTVRLARREAFRARTPRPARGGPAEGADRGHAARQAARVSATVNAIRAGDEAVAQRPARNGSSRPQSPTATMALLREATDAGRPVWIGYVDADGAAVERVVEPRRVEGGQLSAYDRRADEVRSFAIHRITAVRLLAPAARGPNLPET
ncbi:MAG TPA: helicase C-terminal domain-containing protein [Nocardioidaceae bacterium]|nr:helicase C-terminal domain-containing protein [Nocardioidaceae bacterium]